KARKDAFAIAHITLRAADESGQVGCQGKLLIDGKVSGEAAAVGQSVSRGSIDRTRGRQVLRQLSIIPRDPGGDCQASQGPDVDRKLHALALGTTAVGIIGLAGGEVFQVELDVFPVDIVDGAVEAQYAIERLTLEADLVVLRLVRSVFERHATHVVVGPTGPVPGRQTRIDHEVRRNFEAGRHQVGEGV